MGKTYKKLDDNTAEVTETESVTTKLNYTFLQSEIANKKRLLKELSDRTKAEVAELEIQILELESVGVSGYKLVEAIDEIHS